MPAMTPGRSMGSRAIVAMSGGVDSSVVAALLKAEGHETIGVTLQLYDQGRTATRPGACCAGADIRDARRVAAMLDIPHYVLDYKERFRTSVLEAFADSYLGGETPVPCVLCNQGVKFSDLLTTVRELGGDCLATGHYVRRIEGHEGPELHCGAETGRDQSYFLFRTTRRQLQDLRFPLGGMTKDEVRASARRFGLPVSAKPDSQDICFVPRGRYTQIVDRLRPGAMEAGTIVDLSGRVLGHHDGIAHYTVGQRRRLGIATGEPLFVISLDPERRQVVVGPREALGSSSLAMRDVNWIGAGELPQNGLACHVQLRSRQERLPARVLPLVDNRARVELARPAEAIAPGQACVMYDGSRLLGGGWIERERERSSMPRHGSAHACS